MTFTVAHDLLWHPPCDQATQNDFDRAFIQEETMAQYIVLTRVSPEAVKKPEGLLDLEQKVKDRVASECPQVKWTANYAVMGPYDYIDLFEAPDNETAMRVSTIIRSEGNASTELWPATEWSQFRDQVLK
jgi:uncharacterized protein with GYD domain